MNIDHSVGQVKTCYSVLPTLYIARQKCELLSCFANFCFHCWCDTLYMYVTGFEIICSNCPLVKCEHKSFWVSTNPTLIECIKFNGWCKLHILIDLDKFLIKYSYELKKVQKPEYKTNKFVRCWNVHILWKGIYLLNASPSQRKQTVNKPDKKLEVKILRFFLEERVV